MNSMSKTKFSNYLLSNTFMVGFEDLIVMFYI